MKLSVIALVIFSCFNLYSQKNKDYIINTLHYDEIQFSVQGTNIPANVWELNAFRIDNDDPMFNVAGSLIKVSTYDSVKNSNPTILTNEALFKFNWAEDNDTGQPMIAQGNYEFFVIKNDTIKFKFKFDSRYCSESSEHDCYFKYYPENNIVVFVFNGEQNIPYNSQQYEWELKGGTPNWECFFREFEVITAFDSDTILSPINVPIELTELDEFDDYSTPQVGDQFLPTQKITLLKNGTYKFLAFDDLCGYNGSNYRFRRWYKNHFYNTYNLENPFVIISYFSLDNYYNLTVPLTVLNNLEGGSGGTYDVAWDKMPGDPETVSSLSPYYAFDFADNEDVYDIQIEPSFGYDGTTWYFQKWDDGATSTTRNDEEIRSTNKTFTANYKGISRSDNEEAYSNGGQRKLIKTNGRLFNIYESLGRIWVERSTDNGSSWTLANGGNPMPVTPGYKCKLPSGAVDVNRLIYVNENYFYLTYQEYSEVYPESQIRLFYMNDGNISMEITDGTSVLVSVESSDDMNPVVAISKPNNLILLWNQKTGDDVGIYYHYILHNTNNMPEEYEIETSHRPVQINNTTNQSGVMSVVPQSKSNSFAPFHLAWQQSVAEIRYMKLSPASGSIVQSDYAVVSSGSGYYTNRKPSITISNNLPVISWQAIEVDPVTLSKVIKRGKASYGTWGFSGIM